VPRLSTIIPHQGNDSALETTILSVLENQPRDCEVIVVHDGSYSDPYQLSDELLLIEERSSNPVRRLNAALVAACSPVVCVLSSAAVVSQEGWSDTVEGILEAAGVASASSWAVETICGNNHSFGICPKALSESGLLQRGQVDSKKNVPPASPNLICGFYDRRTLLALDGWNEQLCWENADVELAMLMDKMGIQCELADFTVEFRSSTARMQSNQAVKQMAEVAVAYGLSGTGASTAMTDLLRGCLTGNISGSVAWATAIMSARGAASIQARYERAKAKYECLVEQRQLSTAAWSTQQYRRAG
jgi:hypothetical protein